MSSRMRLVRPAPARSGSAPAHQQEGPTSELQERASADLGPRPAHELGPPGESPSGVAPGLPNIPVHAPTRGGRALPRAVRERMESTFGQDFQKVRIHEGPVPDALDAEALTRGNHIYFRPGGFQPETRGGQHTLAHELTHVLQQRAGRVAAPGGEGPINEHPTLESEAEQTAARLTRGSPLGPLVPSSAGPSAGMSAQPAVFQPRRKKGGRGRHKQYKNDRAARAADKRMPPEGGVEWGRVEPLPPSQGLPGKTKQERDEERRQLKLSRKRRDDSQMHFREPESDTMRVYRAEVESFNPKYSHVNVSKDGRANVYTPPQGSTGTLPSGEKYETTTPGGYIHEGSDPPRFIQSKRTPKLRPDNMQRYGRKFLRGREGQPKGTMNWINFGEAERALEFHHQKSTNPTEKAKGNTFNIKSFEIPSDIYRAIREDTVHENERSKHPTKAINVDRAAPNQFGLQQHHVELLNQTAIPGSARVEDPKKLARQVGFTPPKPERPREEPKRKSRNKGPKWARKLQPDASALDDMLAGEEDARLELAQAEEEDGLSDE